MQLNAEPDFPRSADIRANETSSGAILSERNSMIMEPRARPPLRPDIGGLPGFQERRCKRLKYTLTKTQILRNMYCIRLLRLYLVSLSAPPPP
jgi:hypothetical protein